MSFLSSFPNSTASSRSASKSSSHMANKAQREVVRLAVACHATITGDGMSVTENGKKYPRLAGELGEDDFKRYCAEPPILSLQKIHYCQSRLEQLKAFVNGSIEASKKELKDLSGVQVTTEEAQGIQKMRGLINHDYLVLEVQSSSPVETLYILAQKNSGKGTAGIYIQKAEPEDYDEKNVVLLGIDCGGVPMKLDSLQTLLLEADTPHYNLQDNNCWDYATKATKRLLNECIFKVSGGDEAKRARLQKALQCLEANLYSKNIINIWKRLVAWSTGNR